MKLILTVGNYILNYSLLKWLTSVSWLYNWDCFSSETSDLTYQRQKNGSWNKRLKNVNNHHLYHEQHLVLHQLPDCILRSSVFVDKGYVKFLNTSSYSSIVNDVQVKEDKVFDNVMIEPKDIDWFMSRLHSSFVTNFFINA